ncbi:MAG: DUF1028 domain-containing protein [Candidatus Bathyarchaeota archaeon]|nr:MAG: DUF1028 domain-containing protein [Candidatus Bathyarchaeota archaeon]
MKADVTPEEEQTSTFSIVAYDQENGDLGVAVQSKYFSVGPVVPWAEAGIGAVATQAYVNVSYGPRGLELLKDGLSVEEVVEALTKDDEGRDRRQLGIVDSRGNAATYTGPVCTPFAGGRLGENYAVQGNILEGEGVIDAMAEAFEAAHGELAERLVVALEAGEEAGGDARGRQSAALLVVRHGAGRSGYGDRYVELRVDDHETPIMELRRLLNLQFSNGFAYRSHGLLDEGKNEEALEIAIKSAILSPESDIAHLALCRAYYMNGATAKAVEEYQLAKAINEKVDFSVNRSERWKFILENEEFSQTTK